MKKIKVFKKIAATGIAAAMLIPVLIAGSAMSQTSSAAGSPGGPSDSREEVVYANLTAAGETKDVYVVATLHNSVAGNFTDYGNYVTVKNLTDTSPVTLSGNQITFTAPKGDFYYQGSMTTNDLPWDIEISYSLDGNTVPADALAGKNGHVVITIKTAQNANVDPVYFENYMLQISITLDTAKCAAISAPGATLASAGADKLVTFAVMPGKSSNVAVEMDAADFAMDGIQFSAVPLSMKIDPPDTSSMKADLQKLSDAVSELNDGVAQLEDGAIELKNGAADLSGGSASFAAGLDQLNGNSGDLLGGSAQIKEALAAIVAAMSTSGSTDSTSSAGLDLTSLGALPDGLNQLAGGLDGIASGLTDFKTGFAASYAALKGAILEIPDTPVTEADWARLYQDNPDKKALIDSLAAYYAAGVKTKATYVGVQPFFDTVEASLDQLIASIGQISGSLKDTSAQIKAALESNTSFTQLMQLTAGLQELSVKYGAFHDGLTSFAAGVWELDHNYSDLNSGIAGLADGTGQLADGLGETSAGVSELNNGVSDLPEKTDEEIQKLMDNYDKSDMTPVSFAAPGNTGTVSVQFVIKTDKIELPETEAPVVEQQQKETFWDRLVDIFK